LEKSKKINVQAGKHRFPAIRIFMPFKQTVSKPEASYKQTEANRKLEREGERVRD
jgi:hypothetical protein